MRLSCTLFIDHALYTSYLKLSFTYVIIIDVVAVFWICSIVIFQLVCEVIYSWQNNSRQHSSKYLQKKPKRKRWILNETPYNQSPKPVISMAKALCVISVFYTRKEISIFCHERNIYKIWSTILFDK